MSWAENVSAIKSHQRLKSKNKNWMGGAQPSPLVLLELLGEGWEQQPKRERKNKHLPGREQQPERGMKSTCQGWAHLSGGNGDLWQVTPSWAPVLWGFPHPDTAEASTGLWRAGECPSAATPPQITAGVGR